MGLGQRVLACPGGPHLLARVEALGGHYADLFGRSVDVVMGRHEQCGICSKDVHGIRRGRRRGGYQARVDHQHGGDKRATRLPTSKFCVPGESSETLVCTCAFYGRRQNSTSFWHALPRKAKTNENRKHIVLSSPKVTRHVIWSLFGACFRASLAFELEHLAGSFCGLAFTHRPRLFPKSPTEAEVHHSHWSSMCVIICVHERVLLFRYLRGPTQARTQGCV